MRSVPKRAAKVNSPSILDTGDLLAEIVRVTDRPFGLSPARVVTTVPMRSCASLRRYTFSFTSFPGRWVLGKETLIAGPWGRPAYEVSLAGLPLRNGVLGASTKGRSYEGVPSKAYRRKLEFRVRQNLTATARGGGSHPGRESVVTSVA